MTAIEDARAEAFRRYDGDTIIDENTGEPTSFDDWGYAETARQAFIAGVEWEHKRLTAPPTEAMVEAAACGIRERSRWPSMHWPSIRGVDHFDTSTALARAALEAAERAR